MLSELTTKIQGILKGEDSGENCTLKAKKQKEGPNDQDVLERD